MVKVTASLPIYLITPIQEILTKSGQIYRKRTLVLNEPWRSNDGQARNNLIPIEFSGDRMAALDGCQAGQTVTVEAAVNGRSSVDEKGDPRFFVTIKGLSIAPYQPQQPQQQFQQQPIQQGFQQQGGYQQQGYQGLPPFNPQQPQHPQQVGGFYPNNEGIF